MELRPEIRAVPPLNKTKRLQGKKINLKSNNHGDVAIHLESQDFGIQALKKTWVLFLYKGGFYF